MSEETPADGESTVSPFDQATSSIASPIVTVEPHDIEMSKGVHCSEESDIFGKSIILLGSKAAC